jgi:hypothetical protein
VKAAVRPQINIWVALTRTHDTSALWVESQPAAGDHRPLELSYGQACPRPTKICTLAPPHHAGTIPDRFPTPALDHIAAIRSVCPVAGVRTIVCAKALDFECCEAFCLVSAV